MQKLRMLSLCSGIGGADLAAQATGYIEIAGQVEIDPFCQAVLAKHWPNVARMDDIKEVQGHEFGEIDILVAGIPCQGNSLAGKRQGSQDERNLWPETKRIISAALPRWIVVENVVGLLSVDSGQLFATILADLDTLGYRIGWSVYGASEIGAPHQRERVFLVAYSGFNRCGIGSIQYQRGTECNTTSNIGNDGPQGIMAHATSRESWGIQQQGIQSDSLPDSFMAYTNSQRREELNSSTRGSESRLAARRHNTTKRARQSQSSVCGGTHGLPFRLDQHRWPTLPGEAQKENEPTRTITEKIPYRNQRLKALGNAIVPQQIYPLFNAIVTVEQHMEDGDVA